MKLSLFDYDLPKEFIAQRPLKERAASKMLVLEKDSGKINHDYFCNIKNYLDQKDIIVYNDTKVLKCRLAGKKKTTGADIECFVLNVRKERECIALLRPYKRLKVADMVQVGKHSFEVLEKIGQGKALIRFDKDPYLLFKELGEVPLPPYIKAKDIEEEKYQTIFAKKKGSCAAPTAGLHFTKEILQGLEEKNVMFASVTLDIGLDTFKPITDEEIEDHKIHSEYFYVSKEMSQRVEKTKKEEKKVFAVGTTTVRVLETLAQRNKTSEGGSGLTDLYIFPGFEFRVVDCLLTNFHLPKSSLLVMVSAFARREYLLDAYEEAKKNNYRFFSFGDCMLII